MKYINAFTAEAEELIKDYIYQNEIKVSKMNDLSDESLASHYAKNNSSVPSIALSIHHMKGLTKENPVDLDSTKRAIKITDFFDEQAEAIYGSSKPSSKDSTIRILELIKNESIYNGMTLREFYRLRIPGVHNEETAKQALKVFIEDNAIHIEKLDRSIGRPSQVLKINKSIIGE